MRRSENARQRALATLIDIDWPLYLETMTLVGWGWEAGRQFAEGAWDDVPRESFLAAYRAASEFDTTHLLPEVRCPTLVVHTASIESGMPLEAARRLASTLPHGQFVVVERDYPGIFFGAVDDDVALVEEFLASAEAPEFVPDASSAGTTIILFADIVDSTALTERMGDAGFRERARTLDASLREIISNAGGTAIDGKLLGDGVLATFPAAAQAIDAALRCGAAGDEGGLPLHLGIHAGDVIREANNVFGGAVNIASRISGLSAPGEVLVSDVVRALARTSASVMFEDRGEHALKGVGEPQRVYAVRASRSHDEGGG
jgi:class 3 adenylate cyclase